MMWFLVNKIYFFIVPYHGLMYGDLASLWKTAKSDYSLSSTHTVETS